MPYTNSQCDSKGKYINRRIVTLSHAASLRCAPSYKHREIIVPCSSSRRAAIRDNASTTHGVASAAARHAAHEPLRRVLALRAYVADAANEGGRAVAAGRTGPERVAFGALRRVVNVLGAHAAVLV